MEDWTNSKAIYNLNALLKKGFITKSKQRLTKQGMKVKKSAERKYDWSY